MDQRQFIFNWYTGTLTSDQWMVSKSRECAFLLVIVTLCSSLIPHRACETHLLPHNALCVQRGGCGGSRGGGLASAGSAATRTEPLFASGIAMETGALFIESLSYSHSPAVYHSVHMFEANGAQFRARRNWDIFFSLLFDHTVEVVCVCSC